MSCTDSSRRLTDLSQHSKTIQYYTESHTTPFYTTVYTIMQTLTGMDTSTMHSFTHHATSLAI